MELMIQAKPNAHLSGEPHSVDYRTMLGMSTGCLSCLVVRQKLVALKILAPPQLHHAPRGPERGGARELRREPRQSHSHVTVEASSRL
eukprot:3546180-Prymnesium_polylepis.2